MMAFELSVNGKRLCVATTAPNKVLSTILSWTSRHPDCLQIHVGGVPGDDSGNLFDWDVPKIGVGDEITIRVIDSDTIDEPDRVYHPATCADKDEREQE